MLFNEAIIYNIFNDKIFEFKNDGKTYAARALAGKGFSTPEYDNMIAYLFKGRSKFYCNKILDSSKYSDIRSSLNKYKYFEKYEKIFIYDDGDIIIIVGFKKN